MGWPKRIKLLRWGFFFRLVGIGFWEIGYQARRRQFSWSRSRCFSLALHKEFDQAFERTALPEKPDYQRANEFLVKARRLALGEALP